jgi:maleate cis-trans isomerase
MAILTVCTNFPAAPLVADLERKFGIPILDTASAGVWNSLVLAGIDTRPGRRWGSLFAGAA